MRENILQVDVSGMPQRWIDYERAAGLIVNDDVAWSLGEIVVTLRGGVSRYGVRSTLEIPAIIGVKHRLKIDLSGAVPPLGSRNEKLYARDRFICAYCGGKFQEFRLSRDHVLPLSRGGKDSWMNVVTCCKSCNQKKANKTPERANMPLLYAPYIPNYFEDFLLQRGGRTVFADQMAFLEHRLPSQSRMKIV